jgi:DNA-binding MarR family transcriptional regulator
MARSTDRSERKRILDELARVGRAHSDATVLFHATIASRLKLHPTDYKVLGILERLGAMNAGDIARHTGLATASVTNLIDRLEAKGFVKRARDADDRRLVLVEPIPARIDGARVVFSSTAESLARLFECYSVRDLAVIADFLQRNADRLRDETRKLAESPVNDLEISPRSKKLEAPVDPVRAGSSLLRNEAPGRRDRKASGYVKAKSGGTCES